MRLWLAPTVLIVAALVAMGGVVVSAAFLGGWFDPLTLVLCAINGVPFAALAGVTRYLRATGPLLVTACVIALLAETALMVWMYKAVITDLNGGDGMQFLVFLFDTPPAAAGLATITLIFVWRARQKPRFQQVPLDSPDAS